MKYALLLSALLLSGCACPERYVSGENFSVVDGRCGTRQTTDGYLPVCGIPDDGDGF